MVSHLQISLLMIFSFVLFSGCSTNRSAVQLDRPATAAFVKQEKPAAKKKNESFIRQAKGEAPAISKLEKTEETSLIKKNPITKLIGKFNNKPKRIPLPRTDLKMDMEDKPTESFQQKEPDIPIEDISF